MENIAQLSDLVIDQIAAGEIIERPSSVIKELLENSIDSRADTISLNINEGGTARIEVCDNGEGIHCHDLPLSIARHATSKIKSISDLNQCETHGFRGEALAAISSVSKLTIISRNSENSSAQKLEKVDGIWSCSPSPANKGTTVIVEELFFKIPARKRFLKTLATEFSHCKNSFLETSLIHNHITWYFYSNGKEIIKLPAKNINERFADICGIPVERINNIKKNVGPVRVEACFPFSNNEIRRKNNQFIYVNNRAVKNRTLIHAINSALNEITHGTKDSSIFLSLNLPNSLVDFNVHPCKTEVRFKDSSAVYEVVLTTIKNSFKHYAGENYTNDVIDLNFSKERTFIDQEKNKINLSINSSSSQKQLSLKTSDGFYSQQNLKPNITENSPELEPPLGFAMAQLHGIYILAENSEGLIIVDIHAAHERILFENYKKNIEFDNLKVQRLINPIKLQLDENEMEIFSINTSLISSMGFDIIKIDSQSLSIEGIPELTNHLNPKEILLEIIGDVLKFGHAESFESKLNSFLGNLACKSAIKANRKMTVPEMNGLLRSMEKTNYGGKCNHGRPSWAQLSVENIDKIFLRGR